STDAGSSQPASFFPGKVKRMTTARLPAVLLLVLAALACCLATGPVWADDAPAKKRPARAADEPFGYSAAFDEEVQKIGQISPAEFAKRYGKVEYLDKLSFDPTAVKFWDEFQAAPKLVPRKGMGYDFRMNADELKAFKQNGFMVSERMGAASMSE